MDTHGFQCPYYILERALLPDHINTCIDMAERGAAMSIHLTRPLAGRIHYLNASIVLSEAAPRSALSMHLNFWWRPLVASLHSKKC